jgi:hypothetical protein
MTTEETTPGAVPLDGIVRQHTPGPWACFYKHKYDEWHVSVPMSEGSMKWALFDDGVRSENPEADARLIAAAPDLLAALRALLAAVEDPAHFAAALMEKDGEALAQFMAEQERIETAAVEAARAAVARAVCAA